MCYLLKTLNEGPIPGLYLKQLKAETQKGLDNPTITAASFTKYTKKGYVTLKYKRALTRYCNSKQTTTWC